MFKFPTKRPRQVGLAIALAALLCAAALVVAGPAPPSQWDLTAPPLFVGLAALSILSVLIAMRHSSRRRLAEEQLYLAKERSEVTLNSIGDAVVCADLRGRITFLNLVAERLTGWPREEALGRPMTEVFRVVDASTRTAIPDPTTLAVERDQTFHLPPDSVLLRRDDFEIPIEDSISPIHGRRGRVLGVVVVFRDVSAARAMALERTHAAEHDALTGLPNRTLLNDRVGRARLRSSRVTRSASPCCSSTSTASSTSTTPSGTR